MEDKDKIKQALLKFATSLGINDETIRESEKKDVVKSLDEPKAKSKQKRHKSRGKKKESQVTEKQLTSLLSDYTDALGSEEDIRESRKKDVLDAFSAQIQAAEIITESGLDTTQRKKQADDRTKLLDDYMSGIDNMFDDKKTQTPPDLLSEEIQQYIDGRVGELNNQFQQLKMSNATTVDGGGGTVAKQLGAGGKIAGNLQIQGPVHPESYYSGESLEILNDAALSVVQTTDNNIATFAQSGDTKVTIASGGNTTFSNNLSVLSDLYVGGAIRGTIEIDAGAAIDENIVPKTDNTYTIGTPEKKYSDVYVHDLSASNAYLSAGLTVDGQTIVNDVTINGEVTGDLVPVSGSADLGSNSNPWQTLFVQNVSAGSDVHIDGDLTVTGNFHLSGDGISIDNFESSIIPGASGLTLGIQSDPWDELHVREAYVSEHTSLNGEIHLPGEIQTNITPTSADVTLGNVTRPWSEIHVDNANVTEDLSVLGNTTLGSLASDDQLILRSQLSSDVTPVSGETHALGTVDQRWNELFVSDVDASGDLDVTGNSTLSGDVHIHGDLRVDGNAYLSAGSSGTINVGDAADDQVVFNADVASDIKPGADNYNLGSVDDRWNTLYAQNVDAANNLSVSGNTTLGTDNIDTVTFVADIASSLTPDTSSYNLGDTLQPWNTLHVQNISATDNLSVSGDTVIGSSIADQLLLNSSIASDLTPAVTGLNVGSPSNPWSSIWVENQGVAGNLLAGGNLEIEGTSTLSGDVHILGDLRVDGNAYLSAGVDGSIQIGDSNTDSVVFNADVDSDLIPDDHATYDVGSYTKNWNDLYATNAYYTGSVMVSGNSDLKGNTTIGTTSADYLDVNALIGSDLLPESGSGAQQYSVLVTGTDGTIAGDIDNLFVDDSNGLGVTNPGGTFTTRIEIDLSIPITGFDEYVWKYTANSTGGVRAVYARDSVAGTWNLLTQEDFTSSGSGGGVRTSAATLSPTSPFIDMEVDGIRFEYENILTPGGELFDNLYFVLKENSSIVDWRSLVTSARWDLGGDNNQRGEIHGLSGYFTNNLVVSGDADVQGDMVIGSDNFNDITINSDIASDLDPNLDNTYSLGNDVQRWKTLHTTGVSTTGLSAGGLVYPTADGTIGESLVTDGAGNISLGAPNKLYLTIRNEETFTLEAGKPIYAIGEVGSSGVIRVGCADNLDPAKMPAIGIVAEDVGPNSDGTAVINGVWNYNLTDVVGMSAGDTLYVGSSELTNIKPTGGNALIQNIGQILRVNATGTVIHGIKVSSIDRSNDVPNLSAGHIFYSGNGITEQTPLTSAIASQSTITTQTLNVTGALLSGGKDLRVDLNTIDQRIDGLYNYLISNSVNNYSVSSTNINDFLTSEYSTISATADLGDTITLSATDDVYVLSNNIGDVSDDWILATLKPTSYITDSSLSHQKVIDSFLFTQFKSAKYIIEVEDIVSGEMYFTELSVVTNGTTYSITPYGINFTTVSPFVEFDAAVNSNSLSLKILQSSGFTNITDCRLKATRTNL